MKKSIYKIIILGAAWGIFEATIGYLLHFYGIKIGSMIWFPVAYFFVHKAYTLAGGFPAALLTALIASSLKLINLLFPGRVDMVVNPAVSIILEALAVVLVYHYLLNNRLEKINPLTVVLTGFIWRSLYIFFIFSMPRAYFDISSFTAAESFLEFMFVKNMINIIIISAGFFAAKFFSKKFAASVSLKTKISRKIVLNPVFASAAVVLAVAVQILLR